MQSCGALLTQDESQASNQDWKATAPLQYSLPNSPVADAKRNYPPDSSYGITLSTSGVTSPTESPRPGTENYKEKAAARRQRRAVIRAMKLKRVSATLNGTDLETISAMMAEREMVQEEVVDKKTAAAVRNRENAMRARQNTKENIQKLQEQNNALKKEVSFTLLPIFPFRSFTDTSCASPMFEMGVHSSFNPNQSPLSNSFLFRWTTQVSDLQTENKNLKSQVEQLTLLLRQTRCGFGGVSNHELSNVTNSR